jgi:hypothetical protein
MNVSEHINRWSAWLAIREITIKTKVAYHNIAIRTAKITSSIQNILISQFFKMGKNLNRRVSKKTYKWLSGI